jgi:hypothetical protein
VSEVDNEDERPRGVKPVKMEAKTLPLLNFECGPADIA